MRLRTLLLAICAMPVLLCTSASAKEDLVIGVQAFPSSLHPAIDAILIKGYVLGFALRPITAYDQDWKLICMLCAELPTIENGLARNRRSAQRRQGHGRHDQAQTRAEMG
jgi:peptide/nickel transport system substrate-binding protein